MRVHAAAITRDELDWPTDRLPATPSYEFSGIVAEVGQGANIAALVIGIVWTRPNASRFIALAQQVAEAGGPTPEQGAELARLQRLLKVFAMVNLALLAVAVFAMATARYW